MLWFKKLLTAIALFNFVAAPVTQAQAVEDAERIEKKLEDAGFTIQVDHKRRVVQVFDGESNELVHEIPFSDEKRLRQYSPKELNKRMQEEMNRVKAAAKSSWSHSLRSLPTESAIFFIAMGAVVAGQLITNYSQNPVGMKHHVDHSLSPMGSFGFFAFMYSQGVTSNLLSMYVKNPKFHVMIPYLGMTVGAFIQTYLSSFAADPNVKACAAQMIGTTKTAALAEASNPEACEKAFEYLVVHGKVWEFAPGIASMLISSALAAAGQSALKIVGIDVALWLTPGSMQLKGIRLLLVKGLQITAFVAIDAWLNRKVTYAWKNMFDGADFYDQNDRLNELMNEMKSQKWKGDGKELLNEVKHLREKMTGWRMMNMSEVYEAHQNWSEALHQMTSMYNASEAVYGDTINQIRAYKFEGDQHASLITLNPLSGVAAKGLSAEKVDFYVNRMGFVQSMQIDTANDIARKINEHLKKSDSEILLYPNEKASLKKIADALADSDAKKVASGIRSLKEMKDAVEANITSGDAIPLVQELWKMLGEPTMPIGLGQAYFANYERYPPSSDKVANTPFYRVTGAFQTPKITDYLVMQMICGPELEQNGKVIRNSKGYPSVFAPPRIVAPGLDLFVCNAAGANLPAEEIYSRAIDAGNKRYHGTVPLIVDTIRPSVLGDPEGSKFENWWKTHTEKQVRDAFEEYQVSYESIVVKLVKQIFEPGKSIFNGRTPMSNPLQDLKNLFTPGKQKRSVEGGPIFNGGMKSSMQEERIYLRILEELMKPSKEFNIDFATTLDKAPTMPLLFNLDMEFKVLENILRRIKVQKIQDTKSAGYGGTKKVYRDAVISDLENYEVEEQVEKIQKALSEIAKALGVNKMEITSPETAAMNAPYRKDPRRDLAVLVLEQLESLATEVMMYGAMANAVTWDKIRNLKQMNAQQAAFNNEIQAKLNSLVKGIAGARH